jgi:hypothetical protein
VNLKIFGHPLNWVIVTVVVLVGAYFWMHIHAGTKQVAGAVKAKMGGQQSNSQGPDMNGGTWAANMNGN